MEFLVRVFPSVNTAAAENGARWGDIGDVKIFGYGRYLILITPSNLTPS